MTASAPARGQPAQDTFNFGRRMTFGWFLLGGLVFGVGGWAATADLSGAIIASGSIVVDKYSKKVQHKDGGIVASIHVRGGEKVEAGQTLIRLDDTQIKAELGIVRAQLVELTGRKARLIAERDGLSAIAFPDAIDAMGPDAAQVRAGETRLFEENRKSRQSQKEQPASRIGQTNDEIDGLTRQRDSKQKEHDIIKKELAQVTSLQKRSLTPITRVYQMERESTRLTGEHGSLIANIAKAKGQISELEMQILTLDQTVRSEAQKELRAIEARVGELTERQLAAVDRLIRVELKAPQGGVIHELNVHTVGGVITAAESIMLIVPEDEALTVEARFSPTDRDQLQPGQAARMRFTAFNQRTTPEVTGTIKTVAADVTVDPKNGQSYFSGRIALDGQAMEKLGNIKLVPGMPVEVFVATGDRTALTYLTKPFTDQWARAFKEE